MWDLISGGSTPDMILIDNFWMIVSAKLIIILVVTLASYDVLWLFLWRDALLRWTRVLIDVQFIDIDADIRVYSGRKILGELWRAAPTVIGKHPVHNRNCWADIWVHVIEMLRKGRSSWVENFLIELFILDGMLLMNAN